MALLCLFSAAELLIFWFVCLVRLKHACLQVYLELKFKLFLLRYVCFSEDLKMANCTNLLGVWQNPGKIKKELKKEVIIQNPCARLLASIFPVFINSRPRVEATASRLSFSLQKQACLCTEATFSTFSLNNLFLTVLSAPNFVF